MKSIDVIKAFYPAQGEQLENAFNANKNKLDLFLSKIKDQALRTNQPFTLWANEVTKDLALDYSGLSDGLDKELKTMAIDYIFAHVQDSFNFWTQKNLETISVGGQVIFKDTPAAKRAFGDWPGYVPLEDLEVSRITGPKDHWVGSRPH